MRENKLIKYTDHTLWYQTDTVAGSSGSPVFNNSWQVAALHHLGASGIAHHEVFGAHPDECQSAMRRFAASFTTLR